MANTTTGNGSVIAYRVASAPGTTSGTWSTSNELIVSVWRGAKAPAGGATDATGSASASAALPSRSFTGGDARIVHVAASGGGGITFTSAPAGTSLAAGGGANEWAVWATSGAVASPRAASSATLSSGGYWSTATVALQPSSEDLTATSTATLTLTGASTVSQDHTAASTATLTLTGASTATPYEGETHTAASTATLTLTGTSSVTQSQTITSTATFTLTGVSTIDPVAAPTPYTPPPRDLDDVISGSYRLLARVDVLSGPGAGASLPVLSGSFTEDALAPVALTGTLDLAGLPEWEATDASNALDPRAGTELALWLGVVDDGGVEHWWQRGVVEPTGTSVRLGSDGVQIGCTVADRADRTKRASTDRRWVISGTDPAVSGIVAALRHVNPRLPVDIVDEGRTIGADLILTEPGGDVWDRAREVLASFGLDLYVNAAGVAVAPPVTSPLAADPIPVTWTGFETSTDVRELCNVIVAEWEEARPEDAPTDWVPQRGTVIAEDTTSSTSVTSNVGRIVRTYSGDKSVLHSQAHAELAARADLANRVDLYAQASGTVVPDPRRHVRDVVDYGGHRYRITRLTWDLSGNAMGVQLGAVKDLALLLADMMAPASERQTTEIVTGLNPLRVQQTAGVGAEVTVEWTDALAGVAVGDTITVLHKGMGRRVGVALLTGKTITQKYAGAQVAQVRVNSGVSVPVTVGGTADLTVATGASTSHRHNMVGGGGDPMSVPGAYSTFTDLATATNAVNAVRAALADLRSYAVQAVNSGTGPPV